MKIIVSGAAGRMGRAILESLHATENVALSAAFEKDEHAALGTDAGALIGMGDWGVPVSTFDRAKFASTDAVIDFTYPKGTVVMVKEAVALKKAVVIGTTGLSEAELQSLKMASKFIPIVFSPNMSVGVNVMFKLLAEASAALGADYDIEVLEIHHRNKKDAPSGTAIRMGEVLAASRGTSLESAGRFSRHGNIGARETGEIGMQTLRAGDVVGEHTVTFAGPGERIEITHRAHNRNNFARGAILAAQWVVGKEPGLYDMMDVLNLK